MKKILVKQTNIYRYNLYGSIGGFENYQGFFEDSVKFNKDDAIALYINCPGGRVDVGVSIVNAIKSTDAKVTAVVECPSYSMASIIALSCERLLMLDNTFLMFHNYSTASMGKGGELMASMAHSDAHFQQLMQDVCHPFITKKELDSIRNDRDIYIYSNDKDLDKRKARHFK